MNISSENIIYNLLIEVLKNEKTGKKLMQYFSKEDEENIIISNKEIYNLVTKNNFLHYKYLTKELKDEFIFNKSFKLEINNLPKIKEILEESDKLFRNVYEQSNIMIIIFYFSFLFLGIDLFFFFVIIGKDKIKKRIKWYSQIPYIFLWIESLAIIIIYFIRIKKVIYEITETLKNKIPQLNNDGIKYFKRKIIYRIKNSQPLSFWYISICFLCMYLPILIKILFESLNTSYEKAYISMAWILFIFYFLVDFGKLTFKVIKNFTTKSDIYKKIYKKGNFYLNQMKKFRKKEERVFLGEFILNILNFSIKCFFFAIILAYLKHLGRKFDNLKYSVKWKTLFIPIYVLNVIIIIWGILYIYSIRTYEIIHKTILYITIIIVMLSSLFLGISIPQILDENWNINIIFFLLGICVLNVSIIIHYYFMKKNRSNNKFIVNEKNNVFYNSINTKQKLFYNNKHLTSES